MLVPLAITAILQENRIYYKNAPKLRQARSGIAVRVSASHSVEGWFLFQVLPMTLNLVLADFLLDAQL